MDEPATQIDPAEPQHVICPGCGQAMEVETVAEQQCIQCPACQLEFVLDHTGHDVEQPLSDERPADADQFDELSALHIRQLVQLRRSSIRTRTYAIIIMLCCLVMGVQLVLTVLQEVHSFGWDRWAILYAISAFVMAVVSAIASRKAGVLHRESKVSAVKNDEPEYVPQFDELSDGSQRTANLEMMQRNVGENHD